MLTNQKMTARERFLNCLDYKPVDRVPNHEVGVWQQTRDRWEKEGLNPFDLTWDWFTGCEACGMDPREYIDVSFGMMPGFEEEILEKTARYEIIRHSNGIVTKALIEDGGFIPTVDHLVPPDVSLDNFRYYMKCKIDLLSGRF